MKKSVVFGLALFAFNAQAALHYFVKNDLVGVKNERGDIIIPAHYLNVASVRENGDKVSDESYVIDLVAENHSTPAKSHSKAFDKQGKFLYYPFWFDSGSDYFVEGKRRFVDENGKFGVVDYFNRQIIPAKYDFIGIFNYGYVTFCQGCKQKKIDDEHWIMAGGTDGVLNAKGEEVQGSATRQANNDIEIDGKFYPYPFEYSQKEQKLLAILQKKMAQVVAISESDSEQNLKNKRKFYVEIALRPSQAEQPYLVRIFDEQRQPISLDEKWFVSQDGKQIYCIDFDDKRISLKDWIIERKQVQQEQDEWRKQNAN